MSEFPLYPNDHKDYTLNEVVGMTLNDYQDKSTTTSNYEQLAHKMPIRVFTVLGLCGEAGEVAEVTKKFYRDNKDETEQRGKALLELGDVLWYLAQHARSWGLTLEEVARSNLKKLADRHARNVIHGSGDNR